MRVKRNAASFDICSASWQPSADFLDQGMDKIKQHNRLIRSSRNSIDEEEPCEETQDCPTSGQQIVANLATQSDFSDHASVRKSAD